VAEDFELIITGYNFSDRVVYHINYPDGVAIKKEQNQFTFSRSKKRHEDTCPECKGIGGTHQKDCSLNPCWECGEVGKHAKSCNVPYFRQDRNLQEKYDELLVLIKALPKYPYNAPLANDLLNKAIKLWQDGGASPVGPSTPASRFFQEFMNEFGKFPQPM
jgi:hypothetical protein